MQPRDGFESFTRGGSGIGLHLIDFWRWSGSDLLGNALRGVIAEFLVAQAVGAQCEVRLEWDDCDLTTPEGIRVEVKSAAYIQTWIQKKPAPPAFGIGLKRGGDAATNTDADEPCRAADVYVFCVLAHRNRATIDPMNLDQWEFYILPTSVLNEKCPKQKSIRLTSLLTMGAQRVEYEKLAEAIRASATFSHAPTAADQPIM